LQVFLNSGNIFTCNLVQVSTNKTIEMCAKKIHFLKEK